MKVSEPLCSVIIPVFNQLAYTRQCVEAILRNTGDCSYELILVDNGSTDGTRAYLRQLESTYDHIQIVRFEENLGYAEANNEGARVARGQYLVLLNNDTIPLTGWLSELMKVASRYGVGVTGSKLIYPESNTINHAGYVYNAGVTAYYAIYHGYDADHPVVSKERSFQALLGACIVVPKPLYMEVGGIAEYGFEDIDLCLKIRERGLEVIYCPASRVYHYGSVTINNSPHDSLPTRSVQEFEKRWPESVRTWDDVDYYLQDGFKLKKFGEGDVSFSLLRGKAHELLNQGVSLINEGQFDHATVPFKKVIELDPAEKMAFAWLGAIYTIEERFDLALSYMEQLLKRDPLYYVGYVPYAKLCDKVGQKEKACQILEQLLANPDLCFQIRADAEDLLRSLRPGAPVLTPTVWTTH